MRQRDIKKITRQLELMEYIRN